MSYGDTAAVELLKALADSLPDASLQKHFAELEKDIATFDGAFHYEGHPLIEGSECALFALDFLSGFLIPVFVNSVIARYCLRIVTVIYMFFA